jgi:hypothetical protein
MRPRTRTESPPAEGNAAAEPPVVVVAADGSVLEVNAAAARLLGRPEQALLALRLQDLVADDDAKVAALLRVPVEGPASDRGLLSSLVLLPVQGPALRCIVRVTGDGTEPPAGGRRVVFYAQEAHGAR